jgi:hypothetical protein
MFDLRGCVTSFFTPGKVYGDEVEACRANRITSATLAGLLDSGEPVGAYRFFRMRSPKLLKDAALANAALVYGSRKPSNPHIDVETI